MFSHFSEFERGYKFFVLKSLKLKIENNLKIFNIWHQIWFQGPLTLIGMSYESKKNAHL